VTRVDQLVFGYREGHELLGGSVEVGPRLASDLLPHTDARFEDDSPHYLVGLPVSELDAYMLVRIWPAPELPRPGAVWAHALLIPPRLDSFEPFEAVRHFRRPERDSLDSYDEPLQIEFESQQRVADVPPVLMQLLCEVVYAESNPTPVIVWPHSEDSERALLALWRGMPSPERSTLSFRTRGRARSGNSAYSVQVAGTYAGRSASGEIELVDPRTEAQIPQWSRELADASLDPTTGLAHMLSEVVENRSGALAAAQLWPAVRANDVGSVTSLLEVESPLSLSGRLVQSLLGDPSQQPQYWDVDEPARIEALLREGGALVDGNGLLPRTRLEAAWRISHDRTLALFDHRQELPNSSQERLIESAAHGLSEKELIERSHAPDVLALICAARPATLTNPQLWSTLQSDRHAEARDQATKFALEHVHPKELASGELEAAVADMITRYLT